MKRSEAIDIIANRIYHLNVDSDEASEIAEELLEELEEAGFKPEPYINPKAVAEGLDDPKWGYVQYLDKYPEHYFKLGRPYEYYVEGYEPENA